MSLASAINLVPPVLGSAVQSAILTEIPLNFIQLTSATNPPIALYPNPLVNVSVQANSSNVPLSATTPLAILDEGYYFFSGIFNAVFFNTDNTQFNNNGIVEFNVQILDNNANVYCEKVLSFSLADNTTLVPNALQTQLNALVNITQPNTEIYFNIISITFASVTAVTTTTSLINGFDFVPNVNYYFSYIKF